MKIKSGLLREEDGIGIVWFAMSFVIIVFVVGMSIDAGRLFMTKSELRKAADAAALSGAQQLTLNDSDVINTVNQILTAHNEFSSLVDLKVKPNGLKRVVVTLQRDVPLYFMGMFGYSNTPVSIQSAAEIDPLVRTAGVVPVGIDEDMITGLTLGSDVTLKVDSRDETYGNFGIVALSGVGGKLYEDALKYGYDGEISTDPLNPTIYDTQTGNVTQKTVTSVNYRISQSTYADGDMTHSDDPRILTILVYKPYVVTTNQLKSIQVTGFAYFYVTQPMSSTDSTIHGKFISLVGKGYGDNNAQDYGAYGVKLIE